MASFTEDPEPKQGDLIEIISGCFKHWAVCVGPNSVVHLTVDEYEIQGVESIMAGNVRGTRLMVNKERLSKVAAGFKYRVNNKHDGKRQVRSPENIVQMALALVGKEWPYRLTQENCEHFAIQLRYGEPICEQKRVVSEPKLGDLIEISRIGFNHWAVYVGDDYMVKLTEIDTEIMSMEKIVEMADLGIKSVVKKERLSDTIRRNSCWINNKHDGQRQVQFRENIVQNALKLVGRELPYSFTKENCERFVMQLRYIETISHQNRVGPEPKPGDLIEISNSGLEHWAVYVGDDYMVSLSGIDTTILTVKSTLAASVQDTQSVVKKQLLSEVVMGCMYRVNNKHDGKRRVRSPQNIVQIASDLVGQEWPYRFSEKNCEHFATELRYGEPISEERIFCRDPRFGDLIEFLRGGQFNNHSLEYDHWAVYVGDNYVVHLTNLDFRKSGPKVVKSLSDMLPKAVVKKELLSEVAAGCEFRVNNKHDRMLAARPPAVIARMALALVGKERPYSHFDLNCEKFAMEIRYGVSRFAQCLFPLVEGRCGPLTGHLRIITEWLWEEDPLEELVDSLGVRINDV